MQGLVIIGPPLHYWYLLMSKVQVTGIPGAPNLTLTCLAAAYGAICTILPAGYRDLCVLLSAWMQALVSPWLGSGQYLGSFVTH